MSVKNSIGQWLSRCHPLFFNLYCMTFAFTAYFCMYAFRKPFSAGLYAETFNLQFLPALNYKIILIISQVIGYTLSKFLGIKYVTETPANKRATYLITSILVSEMALLGFAVSPHELGVLFLFLNGMSLGMVWGWIFSFLEGRRSTELLAAALSTSYIVASGSVKSVGRSILDFQISEYWMPFATGLIFLPLFYISVKLLSFIPPPSKEEEILRTKRVPMDKEQRKLFFKKFAPALICLIISYMFLTAYRDFRDNFAREIWDSVGYAGQALVFTSSEIPIAFCVLIALASLMFVRNNSKALFIIHGFLVFGSALIGIGTYLYQLGMISPFTWMVLIGLGLYLGYVPFGSVLFDRIIAETRFVGTASFTIYLADSFGYLGSILVLLYKNFGDPQSSWLDFFIRMSYTTSIVCIIGFSFSLLYFGKKPSQASQPSMSYTN